MTDTTPPAVPEYGPIESPSHVFKPPHQMLAEMLAPLSGIELGAQDRASLEHLADSQDSCTTDVIASLLHRARAANPLGDTK